MYCRGYSSYVQCMNVFRWSTTTIEPLQNTKITQYRYTFSKTWLFLARNPPPLCAAIPGLKDLASICLQFYNLSVSSTSFYGCIKLVAKLKYVTVEKINIGCLRIPPSSQHQVEFVDAGALTLMDTSVKVKTGYSKVPLLKKYYITNQE